MAQVSNEQVGEAAQLFMAGEGSDKDKVASTTRVSMIPTSATPIMILAARRSESWSYPHPHPEGGHNHHNWGEGGREEACSWDILKLVGKLAFPFWAAMVKLASER